MVGVFFFLWLSWYNVQDDSPVLQLVGAHRFFFLGGMFLFGAVKFEVNLLYNVKGILADPPQATPPRNKGLIRPY